jgi:hypothetical protein
MRTHHVIAVIAAILVGVGLKLAFFTAATAEAVSLSVKRARVDVSQVRNVKASPAEKPHGAPFTFGDE